MSVQQRRVTPASNIINTAVLPASNTSAVGNHIAGMLNSGKKISVSRQSSLIFSAINHMPNTKSIEKLNLSKITNHTSEDKLKNESLSNKSLKKMAFPSSVVSVDEKSLSAVLGSLSDMADVIPDLTNSHQHSIFSISTMSDGSILSNAGHLPTIVNEKEHVSSSFCGDDDCPSLLSDESSERCQREIHSYDNDSMENNYLIQNKDVPENDRRRVRFDDSLTEIIEFESVKDLKYSILSDLTHKRNRDFVMLSNFLRKIAPHYIVDVNCQKKTPLVEFRIIKRQDAFLPFDLAMSHEHIQHQLNDYSKSLYSVSNKKSCMDGSVSFAIRVLEQSVNSDGSSEIVKLKRSRSTGNIVVTGSDKFDFYFEYLKGAIEDECKELQEITDADWMY
jgi:hypothetical protein